MTRSPSLSLSSVRRDSCPSRRSQLLNGSRDTLPLLTSSDYATPPSSGPPRVADLLESRFPHLAHPASLRRTSTPHSI